MSDKKNLQEGRRRHVRQGAPSTPVAVRDAHGHTWEGRVLDLSVGGVCIASLSDTTSSVLEIRPQGSTVWVKVLLRNRQSRRSLWVFGCAFSFPPTREVFEALAGRSLRSRTA